MEESYRIITNHLGKDQHSKVYKIKGNQSGNELIINFNIKKEQLFLKKILKK